MGGRRNPDFDDERENPSRLSRETEERQSLEELVPDGMEDEANIEDEEPEAAEEEALGTVAEIPSDA